MQVVVVSGHRDPDPTLTEALASMIESCAKAYRWVLGDATGIDADAKRLLIAAGGSGIVVRADWSRHGKRAGMLRNEQMLRTAHREAGGWSELTVATFGRFAATSIPDFGGTAHMARMAVSLGLNWIHNNVVINRYEPYTTENGNARDGLFAVTRSQPRVVNVKQGNVSHAVYIGRGSKWGNPFRIGLNGTREQVIEQYEDYVLASPELLGALGELTGKDLACYCSPEACHGDVLLSLANPTP